MTIDSAKGMPTVRSRMTVDVQCVGPRELVTHLTELLLSKNISAVPVTEEGRLVGVVSTTDLVAELARTPGPNEGPRLAADVAQRPVVTINGEATLAAAAALFQKERIHRLVVGDGTTVEGVLTPRDLLNDVKARPRDLLLSALMVRALATVDIGDTVDEAVALLGRAQVHGLVVKDGSRPVGVFTHREALQSRKLPAALRAQPVEDVMSYETICLDDDTPVHRGAAYMLAMDVRRILVVKSGHLVGIVSALDLAGTLAM